MNKVYKLGIVGLGAFGQNYFRTIGQEFPNVQIVAACRRDCTRPDFLPPNCQFINNWQDIWKFCLDGIIVATTPTNHIEIAIEAVSRGIPAIIEKPISLNTQALSIIPDDSKIIVNFVHLFSPAFKRLQESIKDQKISSIRTFGHNLGPSRDFSSLFDYGSHDIAMILDTIKEYPSNIQCKRTDTEYGNLFLINLEFDNFKSRSLVGNGALDKRREFIASGSGISYSYNDAKESDKVSVIREKFKSQDHSYKETEFLTYDNSKKPLTMTINGLLDMIDGLNPGNVPITRQVTRVLEHCYHQTII